MFRPTSKNKLLANTSQRDCRSCPYTFISKPRRHKVERTYGFTQKGNKRRTPLYVDFLNILGSQNCEVASRIKKKKWTTVFTYSSPQYITEMRGHFHVPTSSVGIANDFGLDGPGSNPGGDGIFRQSRPALGPTHPPVQWVPGLSRG